MSGAWIYRDGPILGCTLPLAAVVEVPNRDKGQACSALAVHWVTGIARLASNLTGEGRNE